jgi:quinol monooxygenase YgiN
MRVGQNLQTKAGIFLCVASIMALVFATCFLLGRGLHPATVRAAVDPPLLRTVSTTGPAITDLAENPDAKAFSYLTKESKEAMSQPAQPRPSQVSSTSSSEIFHVAIFRFRKDHLNDAMTAFRALASSTRQEPGSVSYNIYRGSDDEQTFYVVEHWASPEALAAHEHSEVFIHYGQGMLTRYATLHDTVTARAFDVR